MKKILLIICIFIIMSGCSQKKELEIKTIKPDTNIKKEEVKPTYEDNNNTPIGIYQLDGEKLVKLKQINKKLIIEDDIGIFQLYPANEEVIYLEKPFSISYYEKWNYYKQDRDLKEGFNIKFHLNSGEEVSYNILSPSDCMNRWEHLMNYLYDDYENRAKSFYSHIENDQYNENTLFTSIKIQSSYQIYEIDSPIQLTVFTYDSADDFIDGEYRGNSSYTMIICPDGVNC